MSLRICLNLLYETKKKIDRVDYYKKIYTNLIFIGRLKKTQAISMPEPPGSITGSRSETFVGGATSLDGPIISSGGVATHPIVAVTVHECTNSETISHL